jgi:hypothetical protein
MVEARMLLSIKVAPKGMGLNDFVAYEEGFFADEGSRSSLTRRPSVVLSRVGRGWTTSTVRKTKPSTTV